MRWGIWAIRKNGFSDPHWASSQAASKLFLSNSYFSETEYNDMIHRFATYDINIAFKYREYLANTEDHFVHIVKEKS